jgi:hypothetical protein
MQHNISLSDEQETALGYSASFRNMQPEDYLGQLISASLAPCMNEYSNAQFQAFMSAPDDATKATIVSTILTATPISSPIVDQLK